MIAFLFRLLFLITPLVFFPKTSELFEFNKMIVVYVLTIIIMGVWVVKMIFQKRILFRRTILDAPLLLFIFSQVVATVMTIDQRTSLLGYYSRFHGGLISTLAYCLLYWAYVANMTKRETQGVIRSILAGGLMVSIWGIMEHFGRSPSCLIINGKFDTSCWVQDVQSRVYASFGQPNWMAAYIVAIAPLMLSKIIFPPEAGRQIQIFKYQVPKCLVGHLIFVLFFVALLFTKSRSGLVGLGVGYLVFWGVAYWFARKKRKLIIRRVMESATILAITALIIGTPWSISIISKKQSYQPPSAELNITESSEIRKIVWKGAVDVWKNNWLMGTGVETFGFAYYQYRPVEHNLTSEWNFIYNKAHNEYLNLAATTGVLGLGSYLLVIIVAIYIFYNVISSEAERSEVKTDSSTTLGMTGGGDGMTTATALGAGYMSILVTNFFGFSTVMVAILFFLYPAMGVSFAEARNKNYELRISRKIQIAIAGCVLLVTGCALLVTGKYWWADYWYAKGTVSALEKARELSPREAIFRTELAQAYALEGKAQEAEEQVEVAMKLSARNIKVLQMASNVYSDLGENDEKYCWEQIKILERLTYLAPTDAKTFYTLALAWARAGEMEKATEILEKTIEMKPNYEKAKNLRDIIER